MMIIIILIIVKNVIIIIVINNNKNNNVPMIMSFVGQECIIVVLFDPCGKEGEVSNLYALVLKSTCQREATFVFVIYTSTTELLS